MKSGESGRIDEQSPLAQALAAVGDRWTLLVVEALLAGPLRFNRLQEEIAGIAPNILTQPPAAAGGGGPGARAAVLRAPARAMCTS